jgi:hypothetical protein
VQVYRKPGRLCWKVTISVSEDNSTFWFYLQIIIHIWPRLVYCFHKTFFVEQMSEKVLQKIYYHVKQQFTNECLSF